MTERFTIDITGRFEVEAETAKEARRYALKSLSNAWKNQRLGDDRLKLPFSEWGFSIANVHPTPAGTIERLVARRDQEEGRRPGYLEKTTQAYIDSLDTE